MCINVRLLLSLASLLFACIEALGQGMPMPGFALRGSELSSAMRCVDVETSYVDAEGIMRMLKDQHQKMHDDPDFNNYVPSEEGVYINVHEFRMLWDRFAR